jgi:superfamily II DNA helicase RecQ
MPQPLEILKSVFGYDTFRDAQAEIVEHSAAWGTPS